MDALQELMMGEADRWAQREHEGDDVRRALLRELIFYSYLTPREEKIVLMLYGEGKKVAEVAEWFELGRSRILQLRDKALKKLMAPRDPS